ncbi:hypothetical protein F4802DRAFT_556331 [Xylaria palmicola]|nr:hypothetical protein F4802DRAFT_556331 [Xylaria palmicola]
MDGLYIDTLGMPPIDHQSTNPTLSQSTPDVYPNEPALCSKSEEKRLSNQGCQLFQGDYKPRDNDDGSPVSPRSTFELPVRRALPALLSPSPPENEDDFRHITPTQNECATYLPSGPVIKNEEIKSMEEFIVVDKCLCFCDNRNCPCIYGHCGNCPKGPKHYTRFLNRRYVFHRNPTVSYCCYGCLRPSRGDDDNRVGGGAIIEPGYILGRAKLWLDSATDRAQRTYFGLVMAMGLGRHGDGESDQAKP